MGNKVLFGIGVVQSAVCRKHSAIQFNRDVSSAHSVVRPPPSLEAQLFLCACPFLLSACTITLRLAIDYSHGVEKVFLLQPSLPHEKFHGRSRQQGCTAVGTGNQSFSVTTRGCCLSLND